MAKAKPASAAEAVHILMSRDVDGLAREGWIVRMPAGDARPLLDSGSAVLATIHQVEIARPRHVLDLVPADVAEPPAPEPETPPQPEGEPNSPPAG